MIVCPRFAIFRPQLVDLVGKVLVIVDFLPGLHEVDDVGHALDARQDRRGQFLEEGGENGHVSLDVLLVPLPAERLREPAGAFGRQPDELHRLFGLLAALLRRKTRKTAAWAATSD